MGLPAPIQLYMTSNAFSGVGNVQHGRLATTSSANATTTFGWNMGQNTIPRVVQMDMGVEVSRTATNPAWNTTITGSGPNNFLGDSWVYGPLEGDFDATNWEISWSFRSVTAASTQRGRILFRIYKAPAVTLSGSVYPPYLLSASFFSGSGAALTNSFVPTSDTATLSATTIRSAVTASFNLGPQQFRNEYLMFQTFFNLLNTASSNNADADWLIGATSGTIKTANFTPYGMDAVKWSSDDFG